MHEGDGSRRLHAATAGATLLLVGLHLWLSGHVADPTVVFDENGYLGTARWMAGGAVWEMPYAPFYSAGYSVVLAPGMALFGDPAGQWATVRLINAVLLASVLPLLSAVLRRVLDVAPWRALAAAAVGAVAPAIIAAGVSATAENLVLPLVPATVLAGWAFVDGTRPTWRRLWLGPAVGALYFAHPRFTVAVPLLLLALVVAWRTGRAPLRVAGLNAALLLIAAAVVRLVNTAAEHARWEEVERLEGGPSTWASLLSSPSGWGEVALTAVGQAWYVAAGSVGLAVVGIALVARRTVGAGTSDGAAAEARRAVLGGLLVLGAAVFATSVLFFAQNQFRADHYVYGRHNDSFTPVWIAVAVAYLLGSATARRPLALLGGAAATIAGLGTVLSLTRDPWDLFGIFSPFAVPAIIRYVGSSQGSTFPRATALSLVALGVVAGAVVLARRPWTTGARGALARGALPTACVGLACWFGWFGYAAVQGTEEFHRFVYDGWTPIATIERLGVDELCVDASAVRARGNLSYPWHLPDVDVRSYDAAAGEEPPCTYTIARLDDEARAAAGDRVATIDEGGLYFAWDAPQGLALWVRPGAEQDRLGELGALLPEGFPTPLPPEARPADVAIVDDAPEVARVAPGGSVRLQVRVAHTGAGSPWPDAASFAQAGHVRVVASIVAEAEGGPAGARSGGELPAWMLPGDEGLVDVEVLALDELLQPLPPGRYDVELGIGQVGQPWFTGGGADSRFVLEVTG